METQRNDTNDTRIALNDTADSALKAAIRIKELETWFRRLTTRQQLFTKSAVWDGKDDLFIANELKASYADVQEFVLLRKWREKLVADAEDTKRSKAMASAWREAVSVKAQTVSLDALQLASETLAMKDAKGFANAARGAASMVGMVRQAEGMDSKDSAASAGVSISVFYIPSPQKKEAQEKIVEPVLVETIQESGELF